MTKDKSLVKSDQCLRLFSSRRQPPLLVEGIVGGLIKGMLGGLVKGMLGGLIESTLGGLIEGMLGGLIEGMILLPLPMIQFTVCASHFADCPYFLFLFVLFILPHYF